MALCHVIYLDLFIVITALNLTTFAESGPLPYTHIPHDRTFRSAELAPFATNIQFQRVYTKSFCSSDKPFSLHLYPQFWNVPRCQDPKSESLLTTLLLHSQGYGVAPSRKMGCVQLKRLLLLKRKLYETRIGSMIAMAIGRFLQGRSGRLLQVIRRNTSKGCALFGGGVAYLYVVGDVCLVCMTRYYSFREFGQWASFKI